jgi:transcriptional regulator with XRE-family HTH domain
VSSETTRDNLLQLAGDDYSLEPFIETFRKITVGKSVRAIAAKTGLDRNQVHRLQTGKTVPDVYSMEVIAKAFGKTGDYFIEYRAYFIASTILAHLDNIPEAGVHFYRKLRKIGRHG